MAVNSACDCHLVTADCQLGTDVNQLGFPLLSLVLWLPTLGALLLLFVPRENIGAQRMLAFVAALAAFAASLVLYFTFDASKGFQFLDSLAWVPSAGDCTADGVRLARDLLPCARRQRIGRGQGAALHLRRRGE